MAQDKYFTRKELHELVWSKPMSKLAKEYHISDVGLKKMCKRHNVPVPRQGYWLMVAGGAKRKATRLPDPDNANIATVALKLRNDDSGKTPEEISELQVWEAFEAHPDNKIVIQPQTILQPVAKRVRDEWKELKKLRGADEFGMVNLRNIESLPFRVSPSSFTRAIHILNSILKAAKARGFDIHTHQAYRGEEISLAVFGEKIRFSLSERAVRSDYVPTEKEKKQSWGWWPKYTHAPTGVLAMEFDEYIDSSIKKRFSDRKNSPLEEQLNKIMLTFVRLAIAKKEEARIRAFDESKRQHNRNVRMVDVLSQRMETARLQLLHKQAKEWEDTIRLKKYIETVEQRYAYGEGKVPDKVQNWLSIN